MADPATLRLILQETMSLNADSRKAAEKQLADAKKVPGHPMAILQLIESSTAAEESVRQAAAIHFKNFIKKSWDEAHEDGTDGVTISENDRNTMKAHLVSLMCTVPPRIQSQISESISLIAAVDYPAKWNNLLPELVQKMGSPDMAVVCGVLQTANSIFKRFRYVDRSDSLYEVILYTLKIIQEPLLVAFVETGKAVQALGNDAAQLAPRFEALRLMCRIFFSLNYQDLPEYFEDNMKPWMDEFSKYLQYKNPVLTEEDEEEEASPIDKLQAAIVENISLYADKDEEPFIPFLPNFTTLVWNLLISLTSYPKHDALVTKSIRFLSSLVQKQMHKDIFKETSTLQEIVSRIVIPNLMIRESDQETFEDDPHDFIMTEIEGSDSESRRRGSQELLRAMCRQFEAETTNICSQHVAEMLNQSKADSSKWAAKDVAIHLMLGISIRRESSQGVSELTPGVDVKQFFSTEIFSELQDTNHANRPMVKATALKYVSTFRNQFTREELVSLMPLLISHLGSPSVVVHTFAAYAIERILVTKEVDASGARRNNKIARTELQPYVEPLFSGLFQIVGNAAWNENDHVMKCIMRSLATIGQDVIPVTGIVFEHLSSALEKVCKNPKKPMFNHYLFESIAVLVKSVCSQDANNIGQLEELLFPPFQTVLGMDITEFTPYVFQILAQLLEFRPESAGLGESFTNLFQPLLNPVIWESKGNVPAVSRLLQAYLKKAGANLNEYLTGILGIFQKLVSSKATEQSAFPLLTAVILNVPRDAWGQHLNMIFQILLTRLQKGKSTRYVRLLTNFFALFVGKFGAQVYFDAMNQIQAGIALTLLVQVWCPRLQSDAPGPLDAKIQVVGLTRLLCDTDALVADANGKQIWAQTLACVVQILTTASFASRADDDDDGEIEIAYDATFSVLTFARQKFEDHFADVADPPGTFVRALHTLSSSRPGVVLPIIQGGVDPKLASGLEAMFQKSGLQLT